MESTVALSAANTSSPSSRPKSTRTTKPGGTPAPPTSTNDSKPPFHLRPLRHMNEARHAGGGGGGAGGNASSRSLRSHLTAGWDGMPSARKRKVPGGLALAAEVEEARRGSRRKV